MNNNQALIVLWTQSPLLFINILPLPPSLSPSLPSSPNFLSLTGTFPLFVSFHCPFGFACVILGVCAKFLQLYYLPESRKIDHQQQKAKVNLTFIQWA